MSLLELRGVGRRYGRVAALSDVDLDVGDGEAVGLVGESGSGKSTLLKCVMRLERPDTGTITFDGRDVTRLPEQRLRFLRRDVQMVFQDPHASLNPRMTVEQLVGEGILVHRLEPTAAARRERVAELLAMVGLDPKDGGRYPASFSGGQRQRIAIARALAVRPRLLVCDEPVSALDVSVQAQVVNVLAAMRAELGLALLFVAHDLAVVGHLCPRVAVIHDGRIVEDGPREQVLATPHHPYTRALLDAVPVPDPGPYERTA
ncbi:ATP-binding cassette domain-containing protein [Pseudonocardia sp. WMMC193]|uniref:ATP-binding cassette domain-containing protein n=1 Tax=Pseudonocardia sp. WMMC193 TaxID=2911965 RepID=UPI001F0249F4|nr:ATP-binding cassette domain-containing protein [Pseudonocardia sp. WMMC193]MCF7547534.1 ATP-binding cassette domain-containing protein [Pseudonocardia sp. WMMC193]